MTNSDLDYCASQQEDEIQALSSIYGDEFSTIELENRIQAPWLSGPAYDALHESMKQIVKDNRDSPVVHLLAESIRSYLSCLPSDSIPQIEKHPSTSIGKPGEHQEVLTSCNVSVPTVKFHLNAWPKRLPIATGANQLNILKGNSLVDRKSTFQAFCARVTSLADVSSFISTSLDDRKIASATHNILAWRIVVPSDDRADVVLADCDDDGEAHAGGRLLHLLTISGAKNVAVMVSRWYGGIQLGPDRFKHINNVARLLLMSEGFLNSDSTTTTDGKTQKHKKKKK